jgi:transcriptional regulator with XRE-family HTH domain
MSEKRNPSAALLWRFATNLKRLRSSRSYTQHQLAERCGFTQGYIGDLEREVVNATLTTLEVLAIGLDCSEQDFFVPIKGPQDLGDNHE